MLSSGETYISDYNYDSRPRYKHPVALTPNLIQLVQEVIEVFDVAQLAILLVVLF